MIKLIFIVFVTLCFYSCYTPKQAKYLGPSQEESSENEKVDIDVSHSVVIPKDGAAPIAGVSASEKADQIITFTKIGEVFKAKNGQTVNFIYDGIDPEETYIIYEQTWDGYNLQLAYRSDPVVISFSTLCQNYIVASPKLTTIEIPQNLRYEQVVWTPRRDGTWEVRIGTTERGCKSKALDELSGLRSKEYEKSVPKR